MGWQERTMVPALPSHLRSVYVARSVCGCTCVTVCMAQRRFVEYFYRMLQQRSGPNAPLVSSLRGTRCILESVRCVSIPHFDSDGGCDPYLILTNGDGQVYNQRADSGAAFQPRHYRAKSHSEIRLDIMHSEGNGSESAFSAAGLRIFKGLTLHGAVKIELWDYDKSSKDDLMFSAWFHCDMLDPTALLPGGDRSRPTLSLDRDQVDGPHLDKKCRHFDSNFRLDVFLQSVSAVAGADAGAAAAANNNTSHSSRDSVGAANREKISGPTLVPVGQPESVSPNWPVPASSLESEPQPQQPPSQPQRADSEKKSLFRCQCASRQR
eukprot:COSAG05_NODE_1167_length_5631_cov_3.840383_5_plen_323_part_00